MKRRKPSHFSRKLGIVSWLKKNAQRFKLFTNQNPRFIALLSLTIALILIITLGTLIPSSQTFEGSLDLQSLSFTSQTNQPFLTNADSISEIYTENALPLTLEGTFSDNESNSDNDSKLVKLEKITLKPIANSEAWWQISGQNKATLALSKLLLTPETSIKNLQYDPHNQRLTIEKLTPAQTTLNTTINTNGTETFTVNFDGYQINKFSDINSFTWQPSNSINLKIDQEIKLKLKFKKTPENSLFWGKLAVKKVNFIAPLTVNQDNFADNYQESAIEGGTVRLADKNYNLSTGQFLTFNPQDSIRYLLGLRLSTEKTTTLKTNDNQTVAINEAFQGFKVDISGETKQIKIGLNEKLPVAKLQASWLEGLPFMSRDVFIALIAFLSSFVATLIGWLWELSNSEENNEEE
jgi:hypothetical protein